MASSIISQDPEATVEEVRPKGRKAAKREKSESVVAQTITKSVDSLVGISRIRLSLTLFNDLRNRIEDGQRRLDRLYSQETDEMSASRREYYEQQRNELAGEIQRMKAQRAIMEEEHKTMMNRMENSNSN